MTTVERRCTPVEGALVGWLLGQSPAVPRLPVELLSAADKATELRRLQARKAMDAAYEAELVRSLAADRPDAVDGGPGRGADALSPVPGTSEYFVDELAMVLNCSVRAAAQLAAGSYVLVDRLPVVRAALADGRLDVPRARVFVDVLGPVREEVAAPVAADVLPSAAGLSLGTLRARLRRAVLAVDAEFAEQCREAAERAADVRLRPAPQPGMSELLSEMPAPVAAACWSTIDQLAWMRKKDGDERSIGQLRSLVHADLILRPWDTSRPPVTAHLTVFAAIDSLSSGGGAPAEVNGQPVTSAHVRELLAELDAVCPGGLQAPTGGSLQIAVTDADGALLATAGRPELERIAGRGCPEHRETECGCPVLTAPPAVDRYTPTPAQKRFVKTRDRTCRMPNCGQPVARVDLDHVDAYARGGATDCPNLCCLCRHHHRLKTHAPGWRFVLTDHGVLRVTAPSGITRTTRPPGLRDRVDRRALPAPPPLTEEPAPF